MNSKNRSQPLTDVLTRVAHELRNLAKDTDRLHCLVDNVHWAGVEEKDEVMRSAQAIDAIEQRLSALSDFVAALAELAPAQWEVEGHLASQKVKLAELAGRLSDQPHTPSAVHHAGDSEFF
ncbi:MAG: hypothetical protein C3F11_11070 [Methylocystaceae bacterium]|nr:MAG: hypothetical protein C3F11_11070 [Methylocystaceae bacterium]